MQNFDSAARVNVVDATNDCQMMSYFYEEKDLSRNEHLNLNKTPH